MKHSFFTIILLVLISCKTTSQTQIKKNNPFESITWLKEMKEKFDNDSFERKVMITQYEYNSETVFLIDDCYQCPDGMSILYNIKKEKVCEFGGIIGNTTCSDFSEKAINEKVIYKNF